MSLPELKNIDLVSDGAILIATIARPEAMNALNGETLESLSRLVDFVERDRDVRVLVITGKGEKAFVAGADIKGFEMMTAAAAQEFAHHGQAIFSRLEELSKPVLAAVNGFALGGGLELALACDLIVASEKAKFGLPECTLGLIPGFGGTVRLPRAVGTAKALELTLTGNMVTANEALALGMVVQVTAHGEALQAAVVLAQTMVTRAPTALSFIKKSIQSGRGKSIKDALEIEASLFGDVFKTEDKNEGVRAFLERRPPQFQGR